MLQKTMVTGWGLKGCRVLPRGYTIAPGASKYPAYSNSTSLVSRPELILDSFYTLTCLDECHTRLSASFKILCYFDLRLLLWLSMGESVPNKQASQQMHWGVSE